MSDLEVDRLYRSIDAAAVDTTGTGDVLRYICPVGKVAEFLGAIFLQTAAASIVFRYSNPVQFNIDSFSVTTVKTYTPTNFSTLLLAGDSIAFVVTAGLAGAASAAISVVEHSA